VLGELGELLYVYVPGVLFCRDVSVLNLCQDAAGHETQKVGALSERPHLFIRVLSRATRRVG